MGRSPRTGPGTIWDTRHRSGLIHLCRATKRLNAKAAVGAFAATRPPAVCVSATKPWRGQTELPRHRHSSAKHARCSPAVRSALVPASGTPCFGQVAADDHRSDFSARSGRSLARVLCVRDRARRVQTAKQVRAQPTSPGRRATRVWFNLVLPEEKLQRTREEPRTVR